MRLAGRHIVVTGATSGIGRAVAAACLAEGARVTMIGRSETTCREAAREIGRGMAPDRMPQPEGCDLSLGREVQALAQRLARRGPIDALISNAGVQPWDRQITPEGIELTFATNVLAHYRLVRGLTEAIAASRLKCIVATGSMVHRWGRIDWAHPENPAPFDPQKVYARSKTGLLLLQTAFAAELRPLGIAVHSIEPGMTRTAFARHFRGFDRVMARLWQPFMRDPAEVAEDFVALLARDDLAALSPGYWHRGRQRTPAAFATDPADAERMMRYCATLAPVPKNQG